MKGVKGSEEAYKEAEELLKNATGAKRVVIFDHTIRSVPPQTCTGKRVGGS